MPCCNNSLPAVGHGKASLSVSEVLPEATLLSPQFKQAFASEAIEQMGKIFEALHRMNPEISAVSFDTGKQGIRVTCPLGEIS